MGDGAEVRVDPDQMLASSKAVNERLEALPLQGEVERATGPSTSVAVDFRNQLRLTAQALSVRADVARKQVTGTSRAIALALADHVAATDQVSDDIKALLASTESATPVVPTTTPNAYAVGPTTGAATGSAAGSIG